MGEQMNMGEQMKQKYLQRLDETVVEKRDWDSFRLFNNICNKNTTMTVRNGSVTMRNLNIVVFFIVFTLILILIMNNAIGLIRKLYDSPRVEEYYKNPTETYKVQNHGIINSKDVKRENILIYGKWKSGKRHNQTCDFNHKNTCCKNKQNLYFEFHNDNLNKIDAVQELRNILKTKKLLLIGDSLMREFFQGVAELLHLKQINICGGKCPSLTVKNGSLTYLRACLIELKGQEKFKNEEMWRYVSEEIVRKEIANYDVILFNQGLHYGRRTLFSDIPGYFNSFGQILHGKVFKIHEEPNHCYRPRT